MKHAIILGLATTLVLVKPAIGQQVDTAMNSTLQELDRICPGGYRDETPVLDTNKGTITFVSHCKDAQGVDTVASAVIDIKRCETPEGELGEYTCPAAIKKITGDVVIELEGCLKPDTAPDRFGQPYVDAGVCEKKDTQITTLKQE